MSKQARFIAHCLRKGETVTVTSVTGDVCPCMSYRGTGYNAEWHRTGNPGAAAAHCNGTGLINTTSTTITLKGFVYPYSLTDSASQFPPEIKTAIGKLDTEVKILYGQVNSSTGAYYDMSGLVERKDTVTYNGDTFRVWRVFELADVGQETVLYRYG